MAAALVGLHLVLALLCFVPSPFTGGDNATYVSLARSLLERGDYTELWDPSLRPHVNYPPVFPALLGLMIAAGAGSWVAFKLLVVAFSAAAVGLSYLWLRRVAAPGVALAVGMLLAISPGVLELSHYELSDIPFWTFTVLALWAYAHLPGHPAASPGAAEEDGRAWRWAALAIVATLLAYFTRSAGLPLLLAGGAWLALRRRWRELALLGVVVGIPTLLWWARSQAAKAPGYLNTFWIDYLDPEAGSIGVLGLVPRAVENARVYVTTYLPGLATTGIWRTEWPASAAFAAFVGLAMVGWARRIRHPGVAELFFPLYLGLMLVLPGAWQAHRYALPLLPLVLLYAFETLHAMLERARRPALLGVVAAVLCLAAVPAIVRQARSGTACSARYLRGDRLACLDDGWRDSFTLAERTRGRLPAGSVVLSRKPTLFYALSRYRSRQYPFVARPDAWLATAREAGAAYLLADRVTPQSTIYLDPLLRSRRLRLCTVPGLTVGRASVLRMDTTALVAPGAAPPPTTPCASDH